MPSPGEIDALAAAGAAAAAEPHWRDYADYCDLRARGLRSAALQRLDRFLDAADSWPLARRFAFAHWVAKAADHHLPSPLLPDPLLRRLLRPTASEQATHDPADAVAQLLLAVFGDPAGVSPVDRYRAAVTLGPADPTIARIFARAVLEWADYAQHELPHGYLGDPGEDAELLEQALAAVESAGLDTPERALLEHRLDLARAAVAGAAPRGA